MRGQPGIWDLLIGFFFTMGALLAFAMMVETGRTQAGDRALANARMEKTYARIQFRELQNAYLQGYMVGRYPSHVEDFPIKPWHMFR
ncbi:unnamed protein product [marine sediment metagenome]|uniref:Uncharacterized protein n=1 Tax=marine sediment metagenome TaxID=412755 RepID=X0Y8R5_9ZZZZ